jgi:PAS domain S-box-containing protein
MRGRYEMKAKSSSRRPDKKGKQYAGAPLWSEPAFRELADNIIDGVYCINTDGYIAFVNRVMIDRSGISPDKFYTSHFLDIVHPAYRDLVAQNFKRVISGENGIPYEFRYESADGQERIVEVHSKPIRIDGKVVGLIGISRDITERKRAEETLKESEERFSVAFRVNPAPMTLSTVDDGVVLDVNDRWLSMLGYARDEMIGQKSANLPIWADYEARASFIRKFLKEGFLRGESVQLRTKSGEIRDTLWSAELVKYRGREVVLSLLYDITERKRAEEALQESEERFRLMVETTQDIIYTVDERGFLTYVNPTTERIMGYSINELKGKYLDEIIAPECIDSVKDRFKRAMKGESIPVYETDMIRKDGTRIPIEFNGVTIYDSEGNPSGRYGVGRDITERKRAEDELAKYREGLEQLVAERTQDLEDKTKALEEVNISLKVLLRHREEDKKELEDRFVMNIKKLIMPFAEKMKRTHLDERQLAYLSIIEKHLNDITSSLTKRMHQFNFTPREVEIASLLNEGKTTKEIAKIIGIATSSIRY